MKTEYCRSPRFLTALVATATLLAACTSPAPRPAKPSPVIAPLAASVTTYAAGFDCSERSSALQDAICSDPALAALDRDTTTNFRQALRGETFASRSLLMAFHQHWLLGRARECKVPRERLSGAAPDPTLTLLATLSECLKQSYQRHSAALARWSAPAARSKTSLHPITAYVDLRLRDDREPALCSAMTRRLNEALAKVGELDPAHIPGLRKIAGTHGPASAFSNGRNITVELRDPGLYASYQMRAIGLMVNGQRLIEPKSLARWITQLPNSGGRFNISSSQTDDYAAIDVFEDAGRAFVLVSEPWGYYSPAARGEAAFAGLYELGSDGLQARCLYQTYVTLPVAGVLDRVPEFSRLITALESMSGGFAAAMAPTERTEDQHLQRETLWTLLSMPLLAIDDADRPELPRRPSQQAGLRRRHDAMMEAIFNWSERSNASKRLYRRLIPLIPAAHSELAGVFQNTHGLKPAEAVAAADLLVIEAIDHAAELLSHDDTAHSTVPVPYVPRYAPAPAPGDLEKGRQFSTLFSALLNQAPANVIADFIRYEFGAPGRKRGRGASGETALMVAMASVGSTPLVRQLLTAGADPNEFNVWQRTALMAAIDENQPESVALLLDAGASVTPATSAWNSDGAGGPDIEAAAVAGRTALMIAASQSSAQIIHLLLKHKAPLNPRDALSRSACSELERNSSLAPAELAELRPLLCRADAPAAVSKTLRQLLAAGGRQLGRDEVIAIVAGTTVRGDNPDGGGQYELRFAANGVVDGNTRLRDGGVFPLKGYWKVDDAGVMCATTAVVIEKLGRRISNPSQCTQFLVLDKALYSATGAATADEVLKLLAGSQ